MQLFLLQLINLGHHHLLQITFLAHKLSIEELEKMSHIDIAYNIIKSEKKVLNTLDLLKEVCNLLNYDNNILEN